MSHNVRLAVDPPDPTWRMASCWPGAATTYVIWDVMDTDEAVPREVRTTIAAALCHLGLVVFLGGPGCSISNVWKRVDAGWAGIDKGLLDRLLRRPTLRLMATREAGVVGTLFDQQGFDWSLRGQAVFVLEGNDTNKPPIGSPEDFASCLELDPPQRAPRGCIAILRPGTDGDFAEFHAMSQLVVESFESHFPASRG